MPDAGEVKAKVIIEYDGSGIQQAIDDLNKLRDMAGTIGGGGGGGGGGGLADLGTQLDSTATKLANVANAGQEASRALTPIIDAMASGQQAVSGFRTAIEEVQTSFSNMPKALGAGQNAIGGFMSAVQEIQSPLSDMPKLIEAAGSPFLALAEHAGTTVEQLQSFQDQLRQIGSGPQVSVVEDMAANMERMQAATEQMTPLLPQWAASLDQLANAPAMQAFEELRTFAESSMTPISEMMLSPSSLVNAQTTAQALGLPEGMQLQFDQYGTMIGPAAKYIQDQLNTAGDATKAFGTTMSEVTSAPGGMSDFVRFIQGGSDTALGDLARTQYAQMMGAGGGGGGFFSNLFGAGGFFGEGGMARGILGGVGTFFGEAGAGLGTLLGGIGGLGMGAMDAYFLQMMAQQVGTQLYNWAAVAEGPRAGMPGTVTGTYNALGASVNTLGGSFAESFGQGIQPTLQAITTQFQSPQGRQAVATAGNLLSDLGNFALGILDPWSQHLQGGFFGSFVGNGPGPGSNYRFPPGPPPPGGWGPVPPYTPGGTIFGYGPNGQPIYEGVSTLHAMDLGPNWTSQGPSPISFPTGSYTQYTGGYSTPVLSGIGNFLNWLNPMSGQNPLAQLGGWAAGGIGQMFSGLGSVFAPGGGIGSMFSDFGSWVHQTFAPPPGYQVNPADFQGLGVTSLPNISGITSGISNMISSALSGLGSISLSGISLSGITSGISSMISSALSGLGSISLSGISLSGITSGISCMISSALSGLSGISLPSINFSGLAGAISGGLSALTSISFPGFGGLAGIISGGLSALTSISFPGFGGLAGIISGGLSALTSISFPGFGGLAGIISGGLSALTSISFPGFGGLAGIISGGLSALTSIAFPGFGGLAGAISGGLSALTSISFPGFGGLVGAIQGAFSALSNISIPPISIAAPTVYVPSPNVVYYAGGVENAPGGYAIIGENGPELVKLPAGSSVYPMSTGAGVSASPIPVGVGGGGGGGPQVINFSFQVDSQTLISAMGIPLASMIRLNNGYRGA